ncbi:hypothetical protein OH773_01115 [Buttiauxella sp. WJP83]|uniref:hypothetical protein n=1 Tax=Buttiauxella sp. WJP83 TaxID=2986951 RepID=UPI0022DD58C5|nr:hypothetical protein [Buttiauxella sp. WJP83]WBM70899.1 hypothetical protein OH773_01115 [Buttiauxella sp. WJP83]
MQKMLMGLQNEPLFPTYPSMNPTLRDMAMMNGSFITESCYVMLLTPGEAQRIASELVGKIDFLFSYRAGLGNIKDAFDGSRTIGSLGAYYNELNKLVFNFRALGIRAIKYQYRGKYYIKITGYASMRRILNGTRYALDNPQILEMAIGTRGLMESFVKGTKFCICCSLAWRVVELIFKSDYDLIDFLVDITMDAAKTIVSGVAIAVVGGMLTLLTIPIIVTTFIVVVIGVALNIKLNKLDDEFRLSTSLKDNLRIALEQERQMREWNQQHAPLFFNLFSNARY